jgi:hypothetical protein
MNRNFKLVVIGLALAGACTVSAAAEPGSFFINGNIGQATWHDSGFSNKTDTSSALRLGYSWQSDTTEFGLEGGYVDLGRATGTVYAGNARAGFSAKATGPLLGANFKYKFANRMFVSARGGWFRSKLDATIEGVGSQSYSGDGAYLGAGVGYDITRQFSIGVGYDDYHGRVTINGTKSNESIGVVSGFAEFRF